MHAAELDFAGCHPAGMEVADRALAFGNNPGFELPHPVAERFKKTTPTKGRRLIPQQESGLDTLGDPTPGTLLLSTLPESLRTVLLIDPLRELPVPRPSGAYRAYPSCSSISSSGNASSVCMIRSWENRFGIHDLCPTTRAHLGHDPF
jgi:hypothetical protein